jgi:sugar phosphate permease
MQALESSPSLSARTDQLLDLTYRKVSRRLMPPLLLAYIIAYLDRVNVGLAKLQMLSAFGSVKPSTAWARAPWP